MRLVKYNPFNELSLFTNSFDDFFNAPMVKGNKESQLAPAVDILDQEDQVALTVELAGMKKEDITVNIQDRVLTISGKHRLENQE